MRSIAWHHLLSWSEHIFSLYVFFCFWTHTTILRERENFYFHYIRIPRLVCINHPIYTFLNFPTTLFIEFISPDILPLSDRILPWSFSTSRARILSRCASPVVPSAGHRVDIQQMLLKSRPGGVPAFRCIHSEFSFPAQEQWGRMLSLVLSLADLDSAFLSTGNTAKVTPLLCCWVYTEASWSRSGKLSMIFSPSEPPNTPNLNFYFLL